MAEVDVPTKGGKKKNIMVHLNVVPFIDMMTILVMFLLMTAVWSKTGRITADQAVAQPHKQKEQKEPPKRLTILITKDTIQAKFGTESTVHFDRTGTSYDIKGFAKWLHGLKGSLPKTQKVIIAPVDNLLYAYLVHVMDACVGEGLNNIMVADADSVAPQM